VTPPEIFQDVVAYFDHKTQSILQRYGPGPRVHYHTGITDDPPPSNASASTLQRLLVAGQERMLWYAAEVWDAPSQLTGEVLDVGCGLGGGAIFWAQEFGAQVTAATCVPSHAKLVSIFAAHAGVGRQVEPLVCDAAEIPGENRFDAAVAVDSSGYLPRKAWFACLAALLRPGAPIFIIDCFLEKLEYAAPFDSHWHTRIGTIEEYLKAAREAGLKVGSMVDISDRTGHFWTTTLALIEAESTGDHRDQTTSKGRSFTAHTLVRDGLIQGGLRYMLLSFFNT
jgi:tocopherol O-methyltransferase